MNIGNAFSAAADAALVTTLSPAFSPYINDLFFLTGAFIFEDLGVTAYKGALASFQSSDILTAAAGEFSSVSFVLWCAAMHFPAHLASSACEFCCPALLL